MFCKSSNRNWKVYGNSLLKDVGTPVEICHVTHAHTYIHIYMPTHAPTHLFIFGLRTLPCLLHITKA